MPITIKPTQLKYKDPSTSQYVSVVAAAEGGSSNVDVQINETSILSNGVANIPIASTSVLGVVKTSYAYGTGVVTGDGIVRIEQASSANIKTGTQGYKPIVPERQHESVFYGLAKAAGTDMSSSSNAVGVYTDAAKTAIQSMLAVPSSNNPVFTGAFSQNRKSNTTVGTNSFSSGDNCEASAEDSHAEGRYTVASGHYSHAEGNYTTASGMASHAAGTVTIANHASQYAFGEYNVEDSSSASALARGNYIEIVGNGTASNAKSNARALDWNGNEYLNGYIYVGCNNNSINGTRIPHDIQINGTSIVSNGVANIPIGNTTTPGVFIRGSGLYQDGAKLGVNGSTSENIKGGTAGTFTPVSKQHEATFYGLAKAAGDSTQSSSSNVVGVYTDNAKSAIQSMLAVAPTNNASFTGSFSINNNTIIPLGINSISIGGGSTAQGNGAIALGITTEACAGASIAIGLSAKTKGVYSTAIGEYAEAQYQASIAMGMYNAIDTITDWTENTAYEENDLVYYYDFVYECTTAHTSTSTFDSSKWRMTLNKLFVIGNGSSSSRSNAMTIDVFGNTRIQGNLYVGANADGSGGTRLPHDIRINGTSIVSNGIATVPIASDATFGVIKTREFTDGFKFDSNNNFQLAGPTDIQIKAGETNFRAITPYVQHTSVFYGLAKAAGDSTQSASSNAVGTYTDAAKTAIQNMLAVAPTSNPVFTDSLSMGRLDNSTVGYHSVVLGYENSAISTGSVSIGYQSIAAQELAVAEGYGIVANSFASHVFGRFNAYDGYDRDPWVAGTSYALDDIVVKDYKVYTCQEANSDTEWDESKWYNGTRISLLQVGYGQDESYRKNVLNLDVSGNLFLGGDVYVHSNLTCTSGNKVATVAQLPTVMTGATASENGTSGLVPTPTPNDMYKFLSGDGTYRSGGLPMVILSYGNSIWADFIEAYNNNVIVYCRASSNANPKTGSQTRMAFMAYVNNADNPTNVEFQYYRSMSSHSGTQMGDQVYVYKLDKTSGWSVTVREAGLKEIEFDASTGLQATWSNNKLTITTV